MLEKCDNMMDKRQEKCDYINRGEADEAAETKV